MDAPKATIRRAKKLRREMSLPEVILWQTVRGKRLDGWLFRRQHPIGPYVLVFYCDSIGLAVEVDGDIHGFGDRPERDRRRDAWLAARGIETLRIPARDVLDNMDGVYRLISSRARARATSVTPLRGATPPPEGEEPGGALPAIARNDWRTG
jgi:very-short-patch-repair endonuclease